MVLPLFTSLARFFLATMSLKRSKSVMLARTSFALIFFAHEVADLEKGSGSV